MESTQTTFAIKLIDAVLNYMAAPTENPSSGDSVYTNYIEDNVVWQHLSLMNPEMKTQAFQSILPRIFLKLEKDGFVHAKDKIFEGSTKHTYAVTFEGTLFSQSNGYRGQLDAANAASVRQAMEDQRNKYLLAITFAIGVGTMVAAVYYIFGLFDYYERHSLNWKYCAYFLSGFAIGLLLWLTAKLLWKIKNKKTRQT